MIKRHCSSKTKGKKLEFALKELVGEEIMKHQNEIIIDEVFALSIALEIIVDT